MTNGEKIQSVFSNINFGTLAQNDVIVNKDYSNNDEPQVFIPVKVWNAEYKEPTTKNDLALIHTEGLDEEIRCTMCTNSMKSDRGCDGSCVVNNDMYKAVMDVIEKRIQPTTKNDLGVDCILRAQVQTEIEMNASRYTISKERGGMGHVEWSDQLIKVSDAVDIIRDLPSVTPQEPRIITCKDCKYYRNKGNKRSYCTKRLNVDSVTDRYREPNFYCADAVLREVEK